MRISYAKSQAPRTHSTSITRDGPVWINLLQARQFRVKFFPPIVDHSHVLVAEDDISAAGLTQ